MFADIYAALQRGMTYARVFSLQSRKRIKIMSAHELYHIQYDLREIEDRARAMRGEALRYGITWMVTRLRDGLRSAKTTGGLATS